MSASQDEIELKLRVPDRAGLEAVATAAGGARSPPARQVNHFFDGEARPLRARAFGLRLREEEGRFFLTAKGPKAPSWSALLSHRREEEVEIHAGLAGALLAGEHSPLEALKERASTRGCALLAELKAALGEAPLTYIGSFENARTRVRTELPSAKGPLAVELELDETHYPGGHVHYEVELELDAGADAENAELALLSLLARAGTTGRPAPGKATRFFAYLDEEMRGR